MKTIQIPKDITLKVVTRDGQDATEEMSFKKFVTLHVDAYSGEWAKTLTQLRQIQAIVDIIEKGSGTIVFERADDFEIYEAALKAIRYKGSIGRQLLPFYEAALKAEEVKK